MEVIINKEQKKQALETLPPIEAMAIALVPDIFHNPKDRRPKMTKLRIDWIYSQIQNKKPSSPIGPVLITKSGINDSIHKGFNRYKAGLYPILDKLIENSVLLHNNIDPNDKRQYILGSKYIRDQTRGYVGIVIKEDRMGNKYYTHTIYQKNNQAARSGTENQSLTLKLHPVINTILQEILDVNKEI